MKIDTIAKLIACLQLQKQNLSTYLAEVGATAADVADVLAQLQALLYIRDFADVVDADKKAVFQIKQAIYNGDPDEPVSPLPVFPVGAFPVGSVSGILSITIERNKRFKLGPGYNKEIGIALGIDGEAPLAPIAGEVTPTIEVFPAQTGYVFSIVVGNRAASDMWEVQILRKGATVWETITSATGKSADITITPTDPGDPEQIQVRVQLKKANQPYGLLSDPAYVTVNP